MMRRAYALFALLLALSLVLAPKPVNAQSLPGQDMQPGTTYRAGTLAVVRIVVFAGEGSRTVKIWGDPLPRDYTPTRDTNAEYAGWWNYPDLTAARQGACSEARESFSHSQNRGDPIYGFQVYLQDAPYNGGDCNSIVPPPGQPAATIPSGPPPPPYNPPPAGPPPPPATGVQAAATNYVAAPPPPGPAGTITNLWEYLSRYNLAIPPGGCQDPGGHVLAVLDGCRHAGQLMNVRVTNNNAMLIIVYSGFLEQETPFGDFDMVSVTGWEGYESVAKANFDACRETKARLNGAATPGAWNYGYQVVTLGFPCN